MQPSNAPKKCEACGTANTVDSYFCKNCGSKLSVSKVCSGCGKKIEADSLFCSKCGLELGTAYCHTLPNEAGESKATKIADILEKKGFENLVTEIMEAYKKEYPQLSQHHVPNEFFEIFWARDYGIAPQMVDVCDRLALVITQVENKVRLREYVDEQRQTLKLEEEESQRLEKMQAEFERKDDEELTREAWNYFEELSKKSPKGLQFSWYMDVDRILRDFWENYNISASSPLHQMKKQRVAQAVFARWQKAEFATYYERLSQDEKEKFRAWKDLFDKPSEELVDRIINFFEKKEYWPALLDRSPQGRRNQLYKDLDGLKIFPDISGEFSWIPRDKWFDVKRLVMAKLPEAEARVYDKILTEAVKWAETNGKESVTQIDVYEFLKMQGLRDTPERFKKELSRDINRRLLPE